MKKIIETQRAPGAIGPYVQGVDLGSMVFTSGQIPVCPQTGEIPADVQDQARFKPRKRQSDRGCCRAERGRYHQDDRVHHRSE
ncbi:Hypothetical protein TdcF in cluster with anaerobic degradation of L-threonine to propionate [Escherichia coli ISC7]|uniref:Uncharacterized protein n=1 Tax=Escherichia coli ISC7 TaxID=1432555 RepID=W1EYY5_ECOLX|nr:Hypothetical protein TdcF in cluster with anaerobic degradation of L-threonine to propionate [Escherichia coli ISC7]